jgi:hypothetical protein
MPGWWWEARGRLGVIYSRPGVFACKGDIFWVWVTVKTWLGGVLAAAVFRSEAGMFEVMLLLWCDIRVRNSDAQAQRARYVQLLQLESGVCGVLSK